MQSARQAREEGHAEAHLKTDLLAHFMQRTIQKLTCCANCEMELKGEERWQA